MNTDVTFMERLPENQSAMLIITVIEKSKKGWKKCSGYSISRWGLWGNYGLGVSLATAHELDLNIKAGVLTQFSGNVSFGKLCK